MGEVAVLDEAAEAAAVGTLRGHGSPADITVGDRPVLHADETAAVGTAGDGRSFHMALRNGNAVIAIVAGTQLTDETADIRRRNAGISCIPDLAAAERDSGRRGAAETAAEGLSACVVGNTPLLIDTVRKSGILGRTDETADMLDATGHVAACRAVREGRGSGRIAGETARIFRSVRYFGRGRAFRIGGGDLGIAHEAADTIRVGSDGRAGEYLAVPEIRDTACDTAHEAAHVLDVRRDSCLGGTVRKGGGNGRSADETTRVQFCRAGIVLPDSDIYDMAIREAGRHLVFVITGDVHVSGEAAYMAAGTLHRGVFHPAGDEAPGGTRMAGEAAGIIGTRDG